MAKIGAGTKILASDLIYRNEEWELDGVLVCADIELRLNVERYLGGLEPFLTIYTAEVFDLGEKRGRPLPNGIFEFLKVWVNRNQPTLLQKLWDREQYDAA